MAKKTARKKTAAKKRTAEPRARAISRPPGRVEDFRPVRSGSARATVAQMGLEGTRTVNQIARKIRRERRTVLLHLFLMNRDCAFGYEVQGDGKVRVSLPRSKTAEDAVR